MEDISLFSTSQTLEELELFSSLPILGESGTLEQYDVYIEETDALKHQLDPSSPLSLSAADLLEEFDVEGWYLIGALKKFMCAVFFKDETETNFLPVPLSEL